MKKFFIQTFLYAAMSLALSCSNKEDSGLMAYYDGDEWGFINPKGEIVINPQFQRAYNFSEGFALVQDSEGLYGFIDSEGVFQSGEPSFSAATYFSEGLAWTVKPLQAPTCTDDSGNILFSCETCEYVGNYSEGLAWFTEKSDDKETKYGYINNKGEIEINAQFYDAGNFKNGLAPVKNKKGKYGYINSKGELKINYQFEDASLFNEQGLAVVYDGKKWGWIDTDGKYECNPQFKGGARAIDDDLWIVSDGEKYGLTTNDGKYIVNPQFDGIWLTEPNQDHDLLPFEDGNEWGYIDKDGKIVINAQFEAAFPFVNGLAVVKSSNGFGIIDKEGKYTVNPQFDKLLEISNSNKGASFIQSKYVDLSSLSQDFSTIYGILDGSLSIGEILDSLEGVSPDAFVSSYYPKYQSAIYGSKLISEAGIYLNDLSIYNGDLRTTVQETVSSGWYTYRSEKKVLFTDKKPSKLKFSIRGSGKLYKNIRHLFDISILSGIQSLLSGYDFTESNSDEEKSITYTFTNSTDVITIVVDDNNAYFERTNRIDEEAEGEEVTEEDATEGNFD